MDSQSLEMRGVLHARHHMALTQKSHTGIKALQPMGKLASMHARLRNIPSKILAATAS